MTTADRVSKKLRHLEYYAFQEKLDKLYEESSQNKNFYDIFKLVIDSKNILLAYRNIKRNKGSITSGADNINIKHIENLTTDKLVELIRARLYNYKPLPIKRVWIDKPGKTEKRPLGIPSIIDRICQQAILQILEPIAEAKFYKHSYGFRPNRGTKHAISRFKRLVFNSKLHYVVDIDIKGFFDNVNHNKLLKQMWSLGIRDKNILSIINKMLKSEIVGEGTPTCGVMQGGVISPLISNIVLNELDHWISSQWETFETKNSYKKSSDKHKELKKTNLKEMWLIRYCDDFKILCRDHKTAEKVFVAVKKWLKERLSLDINSEKSGVINLRRRHSEFLGLKIKVIKKKNRFVTRSDITDKAKNSIDSEFRKQIIKIKKQPNRANINLLNSKILGYQNYFNMATLINLSLRTIAYSLDRFLAKTLKRNVTTRGSPTRLYKSLYGDYKMKTYYLHGIPIFHLGCIKFKIPPVFNPKICNYTEEGREIIHSRLCGIDINIMRYILENPIKNRSVEYNDNRISLYSAQNGFCSITGNKLTLDEMICYNIIPLEKGGTDRFKNLIYICADIYHSISEKDIRKYKEIITNLKLNDKQLARVEKLRNLTEG